MGNEQVICPKAKECGDECFYPIHKTPHKFMVGSCAVMTAGHACPACIPVPSTPASVLLPPDELLTERDLQEFIEGTLVLAYMEGQANSNASATKLAKEIIAKCRQSEAARIKQLELGKKLSMESDNRIEQAIGKVLGYPAYKDDQKNFPNATEADGVCVGDHVAESLVQELVCRFKELHTYYNDLLTHYKATAIEQIKEARADQNKKIGDWLETL
jgi:hypothetical protein